MDPAEQPPPATPDAPDRETMEQIRRRRMEKLGGSSASPAPTASPKPDDSTETARPVPSSSGSTDKVNEGRKTSPVARPKINISPAPQGTGIMSASRKRPATEVDSPAATPPRKQIPQKEEPIDDYADRILGTVFRVTVDPSREVDSSGNRLTYLPNLAQELADDNAPLKLSVDRLEEAIMEAVTSWPQDKPLFDYLLPCWKRVIRTIRLLRGPAPQKEEILKEAKRLCFSNCIFAVTMPELFRYLSMIWR